MVSMNLESSNKVTVGELKTSYNFVFEGQTISHFVAQLWLRKLHDQFVCMSISCVTLDLFEKEGKFSIHHQILC